MIDYISGIEVRATPEEENAVQVFSKILVEDFGYPKEQIRTRPQFRVKARPSDLKKEFPVDIAVFDTTEQTDEHLYMIVECKRPNRKDGRKQLELYMQMSSSAKIGVWYNGSERLCLLKTFENGNLKFAEIPNIPKLGERVEDIGLYKRCDLKPTHNLKPIFRDIRNYFAATNVGATLDEIFAQQFINLLFCKIYDERFTKQHDTTTFRAGVGEDEATVAARIKKLFDRVKAQYTDVFDVEDRITLNDVSSVHTSKVVVGGHELNLDENGEFVSTIDMRPAINAIAEVKLSIDKQTGDAKYEITSLNPLTVEPTNDVMAGILPVNNTKGDGQGYIVFDVKLKDNLDDGTVIDNKASITFDMNEVIETPTWTNETDYVLPTSFVSGIDIIGDSNIKINFDGVDNRSGIWKYDLYYQPGEDSAWFLAAEDLKTQSYSMEVFKDINYGFCVIATDKAGNKEVKDISREYSYMNGEVLSAIQEIKIDELSTKNKKVYDLQGRRVKGRLTPGIYIIKGQKFLVR